MNRFYCPCLNILSYFCESPFLFQHLFYHTLCAVGVSNTPATSSTPPASGQGPLPGWEWVVGTLYFTG